MSGVLHLARPEIVALAPYSPARWDPALVRLHANENPWRGAADRTRAGLNRYPEPQSSLLIDRLAALYGVAPEQVLVGRGSDEGIDLLVRTFCRAGQDQVLICPPTFAMYRFAAAVQGAGVIEVPLRREDGFALDAGAVLAACTPATRLVFLCSPNNPTGNQLDRQAVRRIVEGLAGRALVVIDEAYVEFSSAGSLAPWLARYGHLAILRTLSKAYGLAGARCGAVLAAPEVTGLLRRVIPPYAVSAQTIEAATDALAGDGVEACRDQVRRLVEERGRVAARLASVPLVSKVWPSEANFLLVESPDPGRLLEAGIAAGLLVRDVRGQAGLSGCLRVTIGSPDQNERLLAALEAA
ncbi:MAG: histidinol-phosphate aminotransferase [Proteobacteria bacterium]|nr:histidinol-phosphate aminotransferase [Pseudomonadota bacterium]